MVQNPPSQDAAGGPADNYPPKHPRISVTVNSFNSGDKSENSERAEYNRDIVTWTRRAAKAAIVYSFLTILLLVASGYSIYEARNAVDAANRAADAATAQAKIADDTAKRQLRAYVGLPQSYVARFDKGSPLSIVATAHNFGVTPAYRAGTKGFSDVVPRSPLNDYSINDYRSQVLLNSTTINPGQDREFTTGVVGQSLGNVTPEQHSRVENGDYVIIWYGTMYYSDLFTKSWATDFCFFYKWSDISQHSWIQCRNHQGVDAQSESDLPK